MTAAVIQLDFTLNFNWRTFLQPHENTCSRYYSANVGRFLQADPDPGKTQNPSTLVNKYMYVSGNPIINSDPTGKFILPLLAALMHTIAFVVELVILPLTIMLNPAAAISSLMLNFNLSIPGQLLNYLFTGEFASLEKFHGMTVVKNSMFGSLAGGGFTPGAAAFIAPTNGMTSSEIYQLMMHEYGHYLQYQLYGGWGYVGNALYYGFGSESIFECEAGKLSGFYASGGAQGNVNFHGGYACP